MLDADIVTPGPACLERMSDMSADGLALAEAAANDCPPAETAETAEPADVWIAPMVFIFCDAVCELVRDADALALRSEFSVPDGLSSLSAEAPEPPLLPLPPGGGLGSLRRSHAWRSAALGDILVAGSHSRQRRMKSRKSGSSQPLSAVWSSREPGGPLGFPLLDRPPFKTVVLSGRVVTVQ